MLKNILFNKILCRVAKMTNYCNYSAQIKAQKVFIGDQPINYVSDGNGSHTLLCFPGAMGSIWTDFRPQVEGLDKNKFRVIAWDPPGYGHSRPPNRKFTQNFYEQDADTAFEFMKKIGVEQFSLLGWSDGGISSMILAGKHPENVKKLVVWGANAYVLPEEIKEYEKLRDISKWSDKMKAPLIKLYGEENIQTMWSEWCDVFPQILKDGGNLCKQFLPQIKSPTLILHGNLDALVDPQHPVYLHENIKGSRLHRFPEGKHNIHLRYAKEFNAIITRFLDEKINDKI